MREKKKKKKKRRRKKKARTEQTLKTIDQNRWLFDIISAYCWVLWNDSIKTSNLHGNLDSRSCQTPTFALYAGPMLSHFDPVTEREICELTVRSPTKAAYWTQSQLPS